MTDPDPSVVREVEAFVERHDANPGRVEGSGLRFLFDCTRTTGEIDAALDELAARSNGTDPRR